MCGIAGLVRFDGGALHGCDRARAMRARLRHRGPDGEGEWLSSHAVLQHTRLALLDRSGGAQPMTTSDGRFTIVFGGEIYDHEQLRAELAYPFRSRSDAETVLAAFAAWGPDCVDRLNGMFAFFVWDAQERRGFAARDALGVKPFAYAWDGVELLFASEAHVVARARAGDAPVQASTEAVLEYLVAPYFSGVERPAFEGVKYLPPGHVLEVGPEGPSVRRWFRFEVARGGEAPPVEEVRACLERSVRRACQADEPVGFFLSGGLDSSAIASMASRVLPAPLRAYTIAFEGMGGFDYGASTIVVSDDTPFAELAARDAGALLTTVAVPRGDLAADLERVAVTNDALPAWEQELAQDRLARAAARDVKAVLVGDAADETHFGYHFLLDAAATQSPRVLLERFGTVPVRRDVLADPVAAFEERYRAWMSPASSADESVARATTLIVERWLPRLLHNGDIHTMRSGLEARVPFADRELLALAARIPPSSGIVQGVEKAHLRQALRGVVPESIRTRRKSALPKDQGAGPVYQREATRLLREAPSIVRTVVDVPALQPLLDPARPLDERERAALFRVVSLCHFARHHGMP
jgi:asparagine synthase (glutamine-hydrolysing)